MKSLKTLTHKEIDSEYNCIGQNLNTVSDNTHSYKEAIHNIDSILK
jgi:hypothetical protein